MSEDWGRIEEVFLAALERPEGERAAYVGKACGGDEQLQAKVESLLKSDEQTSSLLDSPALDACGDLLPAEDTGSAAGRQIGVYRLEREIGRGGMGKVFLAVRADEQYHQQVAVKILKRGMDTEEILRRFRNERQTLANLNHPNIARLLDGGMTDEGLPYLVMEYIEGRPIKQYCEERKLPLTQRLRLFQTVCSAVHYAHQNLVIHRDLKPGNILVATDSGNENRPVPKLLDFGIAKVLDPERAHQTLVATQTSLRPMTPTYASPEQVRGEPITTASDVYGLGVLLYELLTGQPPYRLKDRTSHNLEQAICEQEPEKPSTFAIHVGDQKDHEIHQSDPKKLRWQLAGDLDMIVLMALRKEPGRRYSSVEQFSEDIRRYLAGEPVIAQKDTLAYRTSKFVKRNRVGVLAASLVVLSLLSGVVGITWQARVATRERDKALTEARKADQISTFLKDMLASADPSQSKGAEITVREILDQAAEKIGTEFEDYQEVKAALHFTIGYTYRELGLYEQAEKHTRASLEIRRRVLGQEHRDTLDTMTVLTNILRDQEKLSEAEPLIRQTLEIRRRVFGEEHEDTLESINNLGSLLVGLRRYKEAEVIFRETLEPHRRVYGEEHEDTMAVMYNLAGALSRQGKLSEAEQLLRETVKGFQSKLGDEHPRTLMAMGSLAVVLSSQHRYSEAESLWRKTLEIQRRVLGEEHPDTLISMGNYAWLCEEQGRSDEALSLRRKTLEIRQRVLGDEQPHTLSAMRSLALLLQLQGQLDEAKTLYEQNLRLQRRVWGDEHLNVSHSLVGLGITLVKQGDPQNAEPLLREGLRIRRSNFPEGDYYIASAESHLGGCLADLGRFEEAEPLLVESYPLIKSASGEQHRWTLGALNRIIALYESWGKPKKADEYRALLPEEQSD